MKLIQHHPHWFSPEPAQFKVFRQRPWSLEEDASVILVIPVEVDMSHGSAGRCFPHLPRPTDKGHLSILPEVVLQQGGVETGTITHGTIIICFLFWSSPFYDYHEY